MENCVFCKIVAQNAPANIIFEDEHVLALVPLEKVSQGHTLLITKMHFDNIFDIEEVVFSHLAQVMKRLSIRLVEENQASGINLLNANGKDAQQSVSHFHFHLVPRFPSDGLDMWIKQRL